MLVNRIASVTVLTKRSINLMNPISLNSINLDVFLILDQSYDNLSTIYDVLIMIVRMVGKDLCFIDKLSKNRNRHLFTHLITHFSSLSLSVVAKESGK